MYPFSVLNSQFKNFMSRIPNSVAVVSVAAEESVQACTVSSLHSFDIQDPGVMITLGKNSKTLKGIRSSRNYAANILAHDQKELATLFSSKPKQLPEHTNELFVWNEDFDIPHLRDFMQVCFCQLTEFIELANTVLVLGKVVAFEQNSLRDPLIYYDRNFLSVRALNE